MKYWTVGDTHGQMAKHAVNKGASFTMACGLKSIGWFHFHPNAISGVAINCLHVNDRVTSPVFNASAEYNVELNDSPNPTQWLMIRPNLQDVIHPGLTHNVNNAFVLG